MKYLSRFAWMAVVVCALTLSNWSLLYVGHHYGLPVILAAILSVSLDGAALVSADISLRHAREHGSQGTSARLAVMVCAAISAFLNSQHATMLHDGIPAHVMYSAPPLIALTLFELETRWQRRDALKAAGRVPEAMPVLGFHVWIDHPFAAYRLHRAITVRLIKVVDVRSRTDAALAERAETIRLTELGSKADAIRWAITELGEDKQASDITAYLASAGINVDDSYVRLVRSRIPGQGRNTNATLTDTSATPKVPDGKSPVAWPLITDLTTTSPNGSAPAGDRT